MGQFSIGSHPHLFENPRAISADRAVAKGEEFGNFGNGFP